jgi:hypothetical protein
MLGLWFSFCAIHIVQTDAQRQSRILPQVEKDEQIIEEGSTLTLDCIDDKRYYDASDQRWILPQSEVIKMISINYLILNVVTRNRVLSSWKRNGVEDNQENYYKQ